MGDITLFHTVLCDVGESGKLQQVNKFRTLGEEEASRAILEQLARYYHRRNEEEEINFDIGEIKKASDDGN